MSPRTYLVQMPRAEARYLAGIGVGWPATPEAWYVQALREWLAGLKGQPSGQIEVRKVLDDLALILDLAPVGDQPACGPFAVRGGKPSMPGRVEYLGGGAVRLDDTAIRALAELREGDDFRVIITDAGPVLSVGSDQYPAREEAPDTDL